MKAILSIVAASLILPLAAQEMQRPPRPRGTPSPGNVSTGEDGGLEHNIAIRLQGTTTTGSEIDLELTGSGPTFTAQQMVGKDESVLSCEYRVTEADGGYRVSYSIGMQVKMVISSSQGEARNYEYRSVTINGSALCSAGKPVVIVRNDGKPLELVVTPAGEAVERKPVAPPEPVEER